MSTLLSLAGREALARDLQYEHLREAGFLLGRRRWCVAADDLASSDASAIEARAARHLLALHAWGASALREAFAGLDSDDADLVLGSFATIALVGNPKTDLPTLLARFLAGNEAQQELWRCGLDWAPNEALGTAFSEAVVAAISAAASESQLILAEIAIARSSSGGDLLLHLLENDADPLPAGARDTIALALGRAGHGAGGAGRLSIARALVAP